SLVGSVMCIRYSDLLRGTDCRGRGTSCPDQLAIAIDEALASSDK
ncbi:MAG: TSCPD domain-containing protein, partial [Muribaculaceae bacterium]|nr:TSCPD domain-containing protein [Muribaculaceae bacterium]